MKNMKHLAALFLTLALVFSLAACGGPANENPSVEPSAVPSEPVEPSVKPVEPSEEVASSTEPEPSREPMDPATLAGTWELYAWDLLTGGMYTEVADQQFVFTEDVLDYIIAGAVTTHNNYEFTDEFTIRLTDINNPELFTDWAVYMVEDVLTFEDPITGVFYYCRPAAE